MKKTNRNMTMGMSIGMCLGMSIGMSLGQTLFDNMSIGMCMGLSVGMGLGMAIGALKDNEVNKQMEEQGYRIKEIQKLEEDKKYKVVMVNKNNEETSAIISQDDLDAEEFAVGDFVYIDEDGDIEQAFDKEGEI